MTLSPSFIVLFCLVLFSTTLAAAPRGLESRQEGMIDSSLAPFKADSTSVTNTNDDDDYRILNFALSLEHLLDAFYTSGLSRVDEGAFASAGFERDRVRQGYLQIQTNGRRHIDNLLGEIARSNIKPIGACNYAFPFANAREFVDLSEAIQSLAVTTYATSLSRIGDQFARVLGAHLGVESRQSAWLSSFAKRDDLWDTSFETPTHLNYTWSIARLFVINCPPSNSEETLPAKLKNYPVLTLNDIVHPGDRTPLVFDPALVHDGRYLFAGLLSGKDTAFVPIETDGDGRHFIRVPKDMRNKGPVWICIVQGSDGHAPAGVTDENTVAGPAIVMFTSSSPTTTRNAWSW